VQPHAFGCGRAGWYPFGKELKRLIVGRRVSRAKSAMCERSLKINKIDDEIELCALLDRDGAC
jgi:hypothetical protein